MKITDLRELLKNKQVIEEINKHLWIESQKAGYSIGIERATDEWIRMYASGWMKYNMPEKYEDVMKKKDKSPSKVAAAKPATKKEGTKTVKKVAKKVINKKAK
ncbi:MAG: hypothetical protein KKD07_09730 [Candidatus Omnitrophica bacterium]|nr:hypothetical protein [Candidatus Omnitrophota bacterium]MBU4334707.1 hypothetical protein [Candidatus Omnitrophota bacterium]